MGPPYPQDGAVYAYVPAGPFIMGSSDGDPLADDDEKPQRAFLFGENFWIMRTEVTNAQYTKCVQAGECDEPNNTRWNKPAYADHPVTDVDWYQANEYAKWAGGRLPTEAEWERACRGTGARIYPWGTDQPTVELANYGASVSDTTRVGSYPNGGNLYGLFDMAGNVLEWTSSQYIPYPYNPEDGRENQQLQYNRTLRGGSWYSDVDYLRCAGRRWSRPGYGYSYVGFRVLSVGG